MASRTIYTCDRCSVEQNSNKKMWWVGVYISSCDYGSSTISRPSVVQQWCNKCVEETGFRFITPPPNTENPPAQLTLEQKLRSLIGEIALEEVGQYQGSSPSGD